MEAIGWRWGEKHGGTPGEAGLKKWDGWAAGDTAVGCHEDIFVFVCVAVETSPQHSSSACFLPLLCPPSASIPALCVKCHWTAYMCWLQSERNVKHGKTADVWHYVRAFVSALHHYISGAAAWLKACSTAPMWAGEGRVIPATCSRAAPQTELLNLYHLPLMHNCKLPVSMLQNKRLITVFGLTDKIWKRENVLISP